MEGYYECLHESTVVIDVQVTWRSQPPQWSILSCPGASDSRALRSALAATDAPSLGALLVFLQPTDMLYSWVKVFHIVFMVSWMAGLFYLPRLFVYHAESLGAEEPRRGILGAQFTHMERRLFGIIMQPAMYLTWGTGATMVLLQQELFGEAWLWLKLFLVALLTAYHFVCRRTIDRFARGTIARSGEWYRVFNEAPTVVLVLAASLVVFKGAINLTALGAVLVCTVLAIVVGFRAYAAFRRRRGEIADGTGGAADT